MGKNKKLLTLLLFIVFQVWGQDLHAQLTAAFSVNKTEGCSPLVVQFRDESTGNPTSWRWDLGNGTVSFLQNPAATYFNPGTYPIKLVVSNGLQSDSITKTGYITVNATPAARFISTDSTGCFPLTVNFTDQSSVADGTITSWLWDFGDGNTSTAQNSQHTYTNQGNFNVSLQVRSNKGCLQSITKLNYIVLNNGVKGDFSIGASANCRPPTPISFTNNSTGTGSLTYQWLFGDGGTSTIANPTHTYNAAGTYTVKLIVRNNAGCTDTIEKINAITIGTVTAAFTNPAIVCAGNYFTITNSSVPTPVSSFWTFGNGNTSTALNPLVMYPLPGNYTIKLRSNFGACADSVTHSIQVLPKPTAAFSATNTNSCKPPLTVPFTSSAIGAVSYKWYFGDGDSSSQANPSHTYNSFGSFNVKLVVTNAAGCTDTITKPRFVNIETTTASFLQLPQEGCVPYTYQPAITLSGPDTLVSYQWIFGDGGTSTLPNPSHTYTTPGTYSVKLIFTTSGGCTDSVERINAIRVGQKPIVSFTALPPIACAFQTIRFSDNSTGGDQWFWQFGDGGTSTQKDPGHIYQDTGFFSVKLTVWSNGCKDTLTIPNYIYIKPPIAKFTDSSSCNNKFTRWFTDKSIGATSWFWNFGDGTNSTQKDPIHTYTSTGIFIVSLTVKNDTCEHTITKQIIIISESPDFSASDTVICKGTGITFTPARAGGGFIGGFQWDFGDGFTSGQPVSQHIYSASGIYTVRLIITDLNGCRDTLSRNQYIRVNGPTANFTTTSPPVCKQTEIVFNDGSVSDGTHPIKQWIWNYGDGSSDTLTTPPFKHTYAVAGIFTVSLTVKDSIGCTDTRSKNSFIIISQPKSAFISPDTLSCTNKPIRLFNQSFGNGPIQSQWSFGNGTTSTIVQPTISYPAEGDYTIKLIVTDRYGCLDSIEKPLYVHIRNPKALFSVSDSVATCPPLVVQFTNEALNFTRFEWDFGDGTKSSVNSPAHFYTYPGVYKAKLSVSGPGGCTDTFVRTITVRGPQGNFRYDRFSGCTPTTVSFTGMTKDTVSFIWDFNDGTVTETFDSIITHVYTRRGIYLPKMILKDPQGCQVSIPGSDTIRIYGVTAKFGLSSQTLCDSGLVSFFDSSSSNDLITQYNWQLGDGSSSTIKNPSHFYRAPGNYPIVLEVRTQLGCVDSTRLMAPVSIVESPIVDILSDTAACIPAMANFQGLVVRNAGQALSWEWDFGNGTSSQVQQPPPVSYTISGSYIARLISKNPAGCADTVTRVFNARPIPFVDAGPRQTICKDNSTLLQASGANEYVWASSASLSCTNCQSPLAHPLVNTTYHLLGKNIYGCTATDSVLILVQQPFIMTASAGDTICVGETLQLFASGAQLYNWTPATGLDNSRSNRPKAKPDNSVIYQVIGSDTLGCFNDTSFVPVKVYPYPKVAAGNDQTIAVGTTTPLIATLSADVTNINWTPAAGLSCLSCPDPIAGPKQTTTYTIIASNPGGCTTKDDVTVFVFCNNGNLFVPNTFSPNDDGNNDVFYPRGKGIFTIKVFRIFNRWGELVFEKTNFQANDPVFGWDGRVNGKAAGQDVYVYTVDVMCENQTVLKYNGNIALIR